MYNEIDERLQLTSARKLSEWCSTGYIDLENSRQRGLCWNPIQNSLLIHSLILKYPISVLYIVDGNEENGVFCIDGKQRSNAITSFINGEFALDKGTPLIELQSGETYKLSGKTFSELPEELRDKIKEYEIKAFFIKNASDDQLDEIFYRLNNGSAMSEIIKTCSRTKSIDQINLAAEHPIFEQALNAAELQKYEHKNLTIKSWLMLNMDDVSFSSQYVKKIMETTDITDDSIMELWLCLNRMQDIFSYVDEHVSDQDTKKMILSNLAKPTHFSMLIKFIKKSIDDNIDIGDFAKWVIDFFPGTKVASIDDTYNVAAKSNSKKNIGIRNDILSARYEATFSSKIKTASA